MIGVAEPTMWVGKGWISDAEIAEPLALASKTAHGTTARHG
jgi:hypothetical protein